MRRAQAAENQRAGAGAEETEARGGRTALFRRMTLFEKYVHCQSAIQASVEPSRLWRSSNSRRLRYEVQAKPEEITRKISETVDKLDNACLNPLSGNPMRFKLFSHKRGKRVSMLILTPYWLDKASFDVHPVGENKCTVTAFSRSTGVLPVVLPFSFLLNTLFFWVPFTDGLGKMSKYIIKQVIEHSELKANTL